MDMNTNYQTNNLPREKRIEIMNAICLRASMLVHRDTNILRRDFEPIIDSLCRLHEVAEPSSRVALPRFIRAYDFARVSSDAPLSFDRTGNSNPDLVTINGSFSITALAHHLVW